MKILKFRDNFFTCDSRQLGASKKKRLGRSTKKYYESGEHSPSKSYKYNYEIMKRYLIYEGPCHKKNPRFFLKQFLSEGPS